MENKISPPPIVGETVNDLTFDQAIKELINGKRIRRDSWPVDDYGLLADGWLTIHINNQFAVWKVNDGDLLGKDWRVI